MSIESQITRITDEVAVQNNAITAARSLLAQKTAVQPVVNALSVTANGTYTAPSGVDGYSPVTVNVPPSGVTIPSAYGLKEIRYFDFTIRPNDTGYGIKAAGLQINIPVNQIFHIAGKNSEFTNPSASSSWQAFGIVGMACRSNAGYGRGALLISTMNNSGTGSIGATNANFSVIGNTSNQVNFTRAAVEGDSTHRYLYSGTYRIFVFIHEKNYSGSVTIGAANNSLVVAHPDYTSTCSVSYPSV